MKKASADIAADFEAVEMLKHVVFMSQMDRPCFSHSETHVGKSNPRSVAKVMGVLNQVHFLETPCEGCTSVYFHLRHYLHVLEQYLPEKPLPMMLLCLIMVLEMVRMLGC